MNDNPFAAPQQGIELSLPNQSGQLASRWKRLAASVIDGLIGSLCGAFIIFIVLGLSVRDLPTMSIGHQVMGSILGFAIFLIIHGWHLATQGQTIGKLIMRIRIIQVDGRPAAFIPLIGLRYLPMSLAAHVPRVGGFLSLVNILFIFRRDKRCIHDLIAGTKVVNV